ncbi:MAG: chemotaxis protein CheX [Bacteriovoracaceae bacterium]|nr:chemotaxis protein CheX [Bacteriovoracaceae bacterium]
MIDINFINPFLAATLNVLKIQANVIADPGKIYLKKDNAPMRGDVSGVIGIVSDTFNGSVVISFPEQTFLKVMGGMLGEEYTTLSQDILDGAGEITNMIFGQAKIVLNDRGYGIKIALPQVVSGKGHSLSSLSKGPTVIIPFTSSAGEFFVEICLSE